MTATRGFTLLEILLVLVLVSVSAVAVIATFPVSVKDEAKISAQSFYQRLLLLNEEAILSGQDFGVRIDVDTRRLTFLQLTADKGWQKWQNDKMTNQTTLKEGLQLDFELGGGAWQKTIVCLIPALCLMKRCLPMRKKSKNRNRLRNCLCYRVAK